MKGCPDLGHPDLDADRLLAEAQRGCVRHLVPDDHHPLDQPPVGGRLRSVVAQQVDARLLEVVDVRDVVDVAEQVEVGPAHRALVAMAHDDDSARAGR